jgi:hypothetical protein
MGANANVGVGFKLNEAVAPIMRRPIRLPLGAIDVINLNVRTLPIVESAKLPKRWMSTGKKWRVCLIPFKDRGTVFEHEFQLELYAYLTEHPDHYLAITNVKTYSGGIEPTVEAFMDLKGERTK